MARRSPWLLTIYFAFLFCLLLWGRVPAETECRNLGMQLFNAGAHQVLGQRLPTPYCPACNGQQEGSFHLAMPGSISGPLPSKDSPYKAASPTRQSWTSAPPTAIQAPLIDGAALPDLSLQSLRTVVLLH